MERVSISSGLDGMLSFEAAMAQKKTAPGYQVLCYVCPRQEPELGLVEYCDQTGCDGIIWTQSMVVEQQFLAVIWESRFPWNLIPSTLSW